MQLERFPTITVICSLCALTAAQTQRKHWKNILNTTIWLGFLLLFLLLFFFSLRDKRQSTSAQLSSLTWLIILIASLALSKHVAPLERHAHMREPDRTRACQLSRTLQICCASAGLTETSVMDESGRMRNVNKAATTRHNQFYLTTGCNFPPHNPGEVLLIEFQ